MAFGTQKNIILDLYNDKYVSTRVSQYDIDSRDIIIQITDNGVPYKVDLSKISVKTASGHDVTVTGVLCTLFDTYAAAGTNYDGSFRYGQHGNDERQHQLYEGFSAAE